MGRSRDLGEAPLSLADTVRPRSGVSCRESESGLFLLNPKTGICCELNALGARVWKQLSSGGSLRQAFDDLLTEYDVEAGALENDLLTLGSELLESGMLERG